MQATDDLEEKMLELEDLMQVKRNQNYQNENKKRKKRGSTDNNDYKITTFKNVQDKDSIEIQKKKSTVYETFRKEEEVLSEGSKIHAKTKPKIVIKPLKAKKELTKDEKRK